MLYGLNFIGDLSKNGLLNMTRNAPWQFESSLRRAVVASPTESLRASASDSSDLVGTVRGSSAFLLQTVVSRARSLGLHAQWFRLSRPCSKSLSGGESASHVRSFRSRSAPGLASEPVLRQVHFQNSMAVGEEETSPEGEGWVRQRYFRTGPSQEGIFSAPCRNRDGYLGVPGPVPGE